MHPAVTSGFSLPSVVPAPTDTSVYRNIVQDKFTYALNSDATIWDAWVAAVENPTYAPSDRAVTNSKKFSEFLMFWKCNTVLDQT